MTLGVFGITLEGKENRQNTLSGTIGNDLITGAELQDMLSGGVGNDTLNGGGGKDRLYGGEDRDTLRGGSGSNKMADGPGDDLIDGGSASGVGDTAVFSGRRTDYLLPGPTTYLQSRNRGPALRTSPTR